MADKWADKDLPRAKKNIAPAHWDDSKEDWDVPRGRDGRQWVRDDGVERKLDILIDKIQELIDK